jgi:hypothetical protein
MKKIILILSFVLLVLVVLTLLINYFSKKTTFSSKKTIPTPASFSNRSLSNIIPTSKLLPTDIKILSSQTITKVQQLKSQLPIDTEDFTIDYSYLLETFIVVKKTPQAEEKLRDFFNNNQISYGELLNKNLLIFTEKPLNEFKGQLENNYQKIQEEKNNLLLPTLPSKEVSLTPFPSSSSSSSSSSSFSSSSESFNPLIEFLNIFLNFGNQPSNFSSSTPILSEISPTLTQKETLTPSSNSPSNLSDIFNEVGQKVGVPPKILEAVMQIEMPSTFNLSSEQITDYSTPTHYWPSCGPNLCSAAGPMQMTIGVDDNGNTLCPACGAGFCPNAWASYGDAVNSFGGYSHQANPCNIRDNVYGSAAKLKNDSKAADSLNWTQAEVYRAATRYYGSCGDNYRYQRLGNRTYCEYVWDYYQAH